MGEGINGLLLSRLCSTPDYSVAAKRCPAAAECNVERIGSTRCVGPCCIKPQSTAVGCLRVTTLSWLPHWQTAAGAVLTPYGQLKDPSSIHPPSAAATHLTMMLRAPSGVTSVAGANAYAAKLAISPTIMKLMPAHHSGSHRYEYPPAPEADRAWDIRSWGLHSCWAGEPLLL